MMLILRAPRLQRQCLPDQGLGVGKPARLRKEQSERVHRADVVRLVLQQLAIQPLCFRPPPGLVMLLRLEE